MESSRKKSAFSVLMQKLPEELFVTVMPDDDSDLISLIGSKIAELSTIERQIITQAFWNDRKLNEIAEELRISSENCRVIKHRALRKLARSFDV
jgi:RNA polymerase sigma factor (sigma-70 family)